MSELLWDGPHTSSDMETAPLVEVAYSILVGSLMGQFSGLTWRLGGRTRFTLLDRSSTLIRQGQLITHDILMRPR